jgi:hypothetical protein
VVPRRLFPGGPKIRTLDELLDAPHKAVDQLVGKLVGSEIGLTDEERKSSLFRFCALFPGLPVLLMRRASTPESLDPPDPNPHRNGEYWTLIGPLNDDLYQWAMALPLDKDGTRRNDQRWEAHAVAKPLRFVHAAVVAPATGGPGLGPQIIVQRKDRQILRHQDRHGPHGWVVGPHVGGCPDSV